MTQELDLLPTGTEILYLGAPGFRLSVPLKGYIAGTTFFFRSSTDYPCYILDLLVPADHEWQDKDIRELNNISRILSIGNTGEFSCYISVLAEPTWWPRYLEVVKRPDSHTLPVPLSEPSEELEII